MATQPTAGSPLSSDDESSYPLIDPPPRTLASTLPPIVKRKDESKEKLIELLHAASMREEALKADNKWLEEKIESKKREISYFVVKGDEVCKEKEKLKFLYDNDVAIRESALIKLNNKMDEFKKEYVQGEEAEIRTLRWCVVIDAVLYGIAAGYGEKLPSYVVIAMSAIVLLTVLIMLFHKIKLDKTTMIQQVNNNLEAFIATATNILNDNDRLLLLPSRNQTDVNDAIPSTRPRTVLLKKKDEKKGERLFGFSLQGAYVCDVEPRSDADFAGMQEGDQLLSIDDVNVETSSRKKIARMIKRASNEIKLVLRYNPERLKDLEDAEKSDDEEDDGEYDF